MSISILIVALALGAGVVARLPLRLAAAEAAAVAVTLGLLFCAWLLWLASALLGYGVGIPLALVVAGVAAGLLLLAPGRRLERERDLLAPRASRVCWLVFTIASCALLAYLFR